jgi:hypothetical protein
MGDCLGEQEIVEFAMTEAVKSGRVRPSLQKEALMLLKMEY